MRLAAILFAITALTASAQKPAEDSVDRVYQFIHTDKAQSIQEIATAIRTIADIKQVSVDTEKRTLTVRGTAAQIGVAEWLWKELDQSSAPAPSPATYEYKMPEGSADHDETAVRVFYLPNTASVQDFQ